MKDLMLVEEVAGILRCSRMTIYRLIRRGQLRAVRVGRNYRIRPADLNDFLMGGAA